MSEIPEVGKMPITLRQTSAFALRDARLNPRSVVPVEMRYDTRNPYAITMTCSQPRSTTECTFTRDLLSDGLLTTINDGNVIIRPHSIGTVLFELSLPDGKKDFYISSAQYLADFLDKTYDTILPGNEHLWVEPDKLTDQVSQIIHVEYPPEKVIKVQEPQIASSLVNFYSGNQYRIYQTAVGLYYSTDNPYSVEFTLLFRHKAVKWECDRDLLKKGLVKTVGEGDVKIRPVSSETILIELGPPYRRAAYKTSADEIVEFLDRTYDKVPQGNEHLWIDMDDIVSLLVTRDTG